MRQFLPRRSRDALACALLQGERVERMPPGWRHRDYRRARLQLQRLGLPQDATGSAPPFDLAALSARFGDRLQLRWHWRCRSTQEGWRLLPSDRPQLVLAECQSGGRGRQGRRWRSQLSGNLYFTLVQAVMPGPQIGLLPLLSGLVVAEALAGLGISAGLKWPNDVLVDGAKLAGVLVDADFGRQPTRVAIGIGLNWRLPAAERRLIDRASIDLCQLLTPAALPLRTALLGDLIDGLLRLPAALAHAQAEPLLERWRQRDLLAGRIIELDSGGETLSGRACSVDQQGRLLLQTEAGLRRLSSAEVRRVGGGN